MNEFATRDEMEIGQNKKYEIPNTSAMNSANTEIQI